MPDALRTIAAATLAVPVLASIYVGAALRSRRARLGFVGAALAVGLVGAEGSWLQPTEAHPPSTLERLAAGRFRDVTVGGVDLPATAHSTRSTEPPTAEPPAEPLGEPMLTLEPASTTAPVPPPELPTVVRFRPRGGAEGVDGSAALSVRFDTPMDPGAASSFSASIDGERLDGTFAWAENGTVLVFTPAARLPYGARVTLRVEAGARSSSGAELAASRAISFTVEPKPAPARGGPGPGTANGAGSASDTDSGWRWPLSGLITQRFGESLTRYGYHQGIDIDGTTGDPVRAARSGTVVAAGRYDGCGGNEVHIDHGDGLVSWYRHLSRIDVAVGERVTAGALIGRVGDTGCSLGSHLHFAIRRESTFLDPLDFLPGR